jgi:anti-sigma B factor antagonist
MMPVHHDHEGDLAHVRVERQGESARAVVEGELDMSNADAVFDQLRAAAEGCDRLTVDLARLGFIDSAGLSALVRLARAASDAGFTVAVEAPAGSVAGRTLALTGLDQVLPLVGTPDAAP